MAYSETSICNIALGLIGVGRIADINGTTSIERDCKAVFDHAREETLGGYHWGFARKQAELAQNAVSPVIDQNNGGYDYAYNLPSDCIAPKHLSDETTKFKRMGDTLHCNLSSDVYLEYTADVSDAAKFTSKFVELLSHNLGARLAHTVKKDKKLSQEMWDMYHALMPHLETDDASSDNDDIPMSNPYVESRSV